MSPEVDKKTPREDSSSPAFRGGSGLAGPRGLAGVERGGGARRPEEAAAGEVHGAAGREVDRESRRGGPGPGGRHLHQGAAAADFPRGKGGVLLERIDFVTSSSFHCF